MEIDGWVLIGGLLIYPIGWIAMICAAVRVIRIAIAYDLSMGQSGSTPPPLSVPKLISTPPVRTEPHPLSYATVAAVSLLAVVLAFVAGMVVWGAIAVGLGTAIAGLAGGRLLDWLVDEVPTTTEGQISVPTPATPGPAPQEVETPKRGIRIVGAGFVVIAGVVGGKLAYELGEHLLSLLAMGIDVDTLGGITLTVLVWIGLCVCMVAAVAFSAKAGAGLHRHLMHRASNDHEGAY